MKAGELTLEAEIQAGIKEYLELRGAEVFRLNSGKVRVGKRLIALCPPGTPDLVAAMPNGSVLWVEVKTPVGTVRTEQKVMHNRLRMRRQRVIVATSVADVEAAIGSTKPLT